MPEDRGSLLQPRRDAPLSTSSTDAHLTGAGVGCVCVKEHQTSSGLSKQQRSSSGAVAWYPENSREGRGRREKQDVSSASCTTWGWRRSAPLEQLWQQCACRPSWVPVLLLSQGQCSQALVQQSSCWRREDRCSQDPVSVGEGRDIKIPPALLALFEIEL